MRLPRPGRAEILTAVIALAAAFLLAEVFLRLFMPVRYREAVGRFAAEPGRQLLHRRSEIPGLIYELVPGARKTMDGVSVDTNSFGMRDAEPMDASAGPVARIAVLGDSYTFGDGVPTTETYASVLESQLALRAGGDVRFDVLNFGVDGYSTRDEALVLRHRALGWKPSIVIVGYVPNDPDTAPLQPLARHFHDRSWWEASHVLKLIARTRRTAAIHWHGEGDYVRALHADPRTWGTVEAAFADIRAATAGGCGVVVAIFPIIPRTGWTGYAYGAVHDQVAALARANGFRTADILDAWRPRAPGELIVSKNNLHPNALGHRLAAEAILAVLEREGLLECAARTPGAVRTPGAARTPGAPSPPAGPSSPAPSGP